MRSLLVAMVLMVGCGDETEDTCYILVGMPSKSACKACPGECSPAPPPNDWQTWCYDADGNEYSPLVVDIDECETVD